jgi:hypothetical protein
MYGYTEMEALATYFDMDSWVSAKSATGTIVAVIVW